MSTTLRIEELKKKFDENPRRYFAPLANEYRKAGDLQQAISICQAHLPQQPGHMSGHIVYGQALFEARQFDQARTVFETALGLDPENLIALRYLGDIAFELGDRGGARAWYTRVLETDPRNEEIAALMAAMGDDRASAQRDSGPTGAAPQAEGAAPAQPGESPAPAATTTASGAQTTPPAQQAAGGPGEQPRVDQADAELEKLFSRSTQAGPQTPPPGAASAQPTEGGPPAGPVAQSSFTPLSGFGSSASADVPPPLDRPAPSLAAPSFAAQRGDDAPLQNPPALEPSAPSIAARPGDGVAKDAGFVTETMAQLYLKQGFRERALDVYRQLVAQNPNDRTLRERMEGLERELSAAPWARGTSGTAVAGSRGNPSVRDFLARIGSRRPTGRGPGVAPPPGGGPRNSGEFRAQREEAARAASTGSIDALFVGKAPSREDAAAASTLADAFNGGSANADAQIGGRPAHPATTELSLDHVFREGSAGGSRSSAGVSYDQFFAQPGQPAPSGADEPPASAPPGSGSDDIEQFNAWLQGLKKR